jgi:hypothetical protein
VQQIRLRSKNIVSFIEPFSRLYPSQNDLPVDTVKKNPLKRLFLTGAGEEKQGYPSTEFVCGKGVFNLDRQQER